LIAELAVDDFVNESGRGVQKAPADAGGAHDLAGLSKSQIADRLWAAVTTAEETPERRRARADEHVVRGNELEPGAAIEEYQKALAIDPNHAMAHFFLAEAFQNIGNLDAAIAEFSRVTRLAPNDPDGHWSLGDALFQGGQLQAAAGEYACALKLAPNDESVLERYSMLSPGMRSIVSRQKPLRPEPAQTG
jgi:tetratricopeptide (TPR) repeat protein